jgi:hypothetical protein
VWRGAPIDFAARTLFALAGKSAGVIIECSVAARGAVNCRAARLPEGINRRRDRVTFRFAEADREVADFRRTVDEGGRLVLPPFGTTAAIRLIGGRATTATGGFARTRLIPSPFASAIVMRGRAFRQSRPRVYNSIFHFAPT